MLNPPEKAFWLQRTDLLWFLRGKQHSLWGCSQMEPEIRAVSLSGPEVALGATSLPISNSFSHCVFSHLEFLLSSYCCMLVWSSSSTLGNLYPSRSFCSYLVSLLWLAKPTVSRTYPLHPPPFASSSCLLSFVIFPDNSFILSDFSNSDIQERIQ